MKKLAFVLGVSIAGCNQNPPPQAPPNPPPPPPMHHAMQHAGPHPDAPCEYCEMEGPKGPPHPPREHHARRTRPQKMGRGPRERNPMMHELCGLGVHLYPPQMLIRGAERIGLSP